MPPDFFGSAQFGIILRRCMFFGVRSVYTVFAKNQFGCVAISCYKLLVSVSAMGRSTIQHDIGGKTTARRMLQNLS